MKRHLKIWTKVITIVVLINYMTPNIALPYTLRGQSKIDVYTLAPPSIQKIRATSLVNTKEDSSKVLFLMPFIGFTSDADKKSVIHLGQFFMASILEREGIEVKILPIDANKPELTSELKKEIDEFNPNIVCLSAYSGNLRPISYFVKKLKGNTNAWIGIGGRAPTSNMDNFNHTAPDFLFRGAGEEGLLQLAQALGRKNRGAALDATTIEQMDRIKGLRFAISNGEVIGKYKQVATVTKEILEKTPWNWDLLKDIFCHPNLEDNCMVPTMASRYCPGRCTFCFLQDIDKCPHVTMGVDELLDRLTIFEEKISQGIISNNNRKLQFQDNDFFTGKSKDDLRRFFSEFKRRFDGKLSIGFMQTNINSIKKIPVEVLHWLSKNNVELTIGIDYFNDDDLKRTRKGYNLDSVFEALQILEDNKVRYSFYQMFTTPWTTPWGLLASAANILKIMAVNKYVQNSDPNAAPFIRVEPSSSIFQQMLSEGIWRNIVFSDRLDDNGKFRTEKEHSEFFNDGFVYPSDRLTIDLFCNAGGFFEYFIDESKKGTVESLVRMVYNSLDKASQSYKELCDKRPETIIDEYEAKLSFYESIVAQLDDDSNYEKTENIFKNLRKEDPSAYIIKIAIYLRNTDEGDEHNNRILVSNIRLWISAQKQYCRKKIAEYEEDKEQAKEEEQYKLYRCIVDPLPILLDAIVPYYRKKGGINLKSISDIEYIFETQEDKADVYMKLIVSIFMGIEILIDNDRCDEVIEYFNSNINIHWAPVLTQYKLFSQYFGLTEETAKADYCLDVLVKYRKPDSSELMRALSIVCPLMENCKYESVISMFGSRDGAIRFFRACMNSYNDFNEIVESFIVIIERQPRTMRGKDNKASAFMENMDRYINEVFARYSKLEKLTDDSNFSELISEFGSIAGAIEFLEVYKIIEDNHSRMKHYSQTERYSYLLREYASVSISMDSSV